MQQNIFKKKHSKIKSNNIILRGENHKNRSELIKKTSELLTMHSHTYYKDERQNDSDEYLFQKLEMNKNFEI